MSQLGIRLQAVNIFGSTRLALQVSAFGQNTIFYVTLHTGTPDIENKNIRTHHINIGILIH